jgi:hypothetical protein
VSNASGERCSEAARGSGLVTEGARTGTRTCRCVHVHGGGWCGAGGSATGLSGKSKHDVKSAAPSSGWGRYLFFGVFSVKMPWRSVITAQCPPSSAAFSAPTAHDDQCPVPKAQVSRRAQWSVPTDGVALGVWVGGASAAYHGRRRGTRPSSPTGRWGSLRQARLSCSRDGRLDLT